jgi:hypothetical protein
MADVDAEFERGGGHDHAVAALGESPLGALALVKRERRVHQVGGDAACAQLRAEHLDQPLGVREHQPFLTSVERSDDLRRVRYRPDVVELEIKLRRRLAERLLRLSSQIRQGIHIERTLVSPDHGTGSLPRGRPLQP